MVSTVIHSYPARFVFLLTAIFAAGAIILIRTIFGNCKALFQTN